MRTSWYFKVVLVTTLLWMSSLVIAASNQVENTANLVSGLHYLAGDRVGAGGDEILNSVLTHGQDFTAGSVLQPKIRYFFVLDMVATHESWFLRLGNCELNMLKIWTQQNGVISEQRPIFTTRIDQVLAMPSMPDGGKIILAIELGSAAGVDIHGYAQVDLDPYRDVIWLVINIMIIGACLGLILYTSIFYRVIGLHSTVLFILYSINLVLFCVATSGVVKVAAWPIGVKVIIPHLLVVSAVFGSLFVINFFRMREYLPKLRYFLQVMGVISILYVVLDGAQVTLPWPIENYALGVYAVLFVIAVFAAWVARHDKLEGIKFYIGAWLAAIFCVATVKSASYQHINVVLNASVLLNLGVLMLIAITCFAFSSRVQAQSEQLFKHVEDSNMVLLKRVEDRSNTIKAQQKELVEAGKLASLGEVIAGISHEVNNPLAIILGYTGQLKTLLSKHIGHGRFINEILPAIESGVERIRLIINQLNAFSGMYTLEAPSHQKLAPLINNAIHNQNERIVAQSCRVEVPAYLGDVDVYGKTDYLKQIFDIMLGNALDATALASAKWIKIDTVTTQQHLLIRFSNSGTTITVTPSAVSPHDSAKMTAIGLVIARRLAEDQNIELYMDRDEQQIYLVLKLPR